MELFSYDAEASLVGAALLDNRVIADAAERVSPEDMQEPAHRLLWAAIVTLAAKGSEVDAVTLYEHLEAAGQGHEVGGLDGIAELVRQTPSAENALAYAGIIAGLAQRRAIIAVALEIETWARQRERPLPEIVDVGRARLEGCLRAEHERLPSAKHALPEVMSHLDARYNGDEATMGITTGIQALDAMILGLQPGLIIIGARPSMGKSAFMVQCMTNAGQAGLPVLCASMEMRIPALMERMICNIGDLPIAVFKDPQNQLKDEHWPRITCGVNALQQAPIYIDDRPGQTLAHLRARARELYETHGRVGLICIDYVQKMKSSGDYGLRHDRAMEEIIVGLNDLGKVYGCPVLVLAQLNRQVEQRPDKRPIMSDLKESSAFEQEADIIGFLYRHEVYCPDDVDARGLAEIIIAKQREGIIGTVRSVARLDRGRFDNLAPPPYAKDGFDS